jgi:DNA-binding MarR family transcriptional regulator
MSTHDNDVTTESRFRTAYWQALRDVDVVRLRQWEQWHITLPQLRVLYQVRRTPGITTGELARLLGITMSTTSGLVGKLADRGLVERSSLPGDRRQIPLYLTAEGAALVGELRGTAVSFLDQVVATLGDDLGAVATALEKLAAASDAARAALPEAVEGAPTGAAS